MSQQLSALQIQTLFQYQYKTYNNIVFQHSLLAFQCTSSIVAQASLCHQKKKMFLAEQRATQAPLPCATIFEFFNPIVDTPLRQNTVLVLR